MGQAEVLKPKKMGMRWPARIAPCLAALPGFLACPSPVAAENLCQTERPPNERQFHCVEFGTKRFRIPAGHFALWQTGPGPMPDTMASANRKSIALFFFVANLPDLTPIDAKNSERDELARRIVGTVNRGQAAPVTRYAGIAGWVFDVSLDARLRQTCSRALGSAAAETYRCSSKTVHIFRSGTQITHYILESPQENLFTCVLPYHQGIAIGVDVPTDQRAQVCIIARRVLKKLGSYEY